MIGDSQSTRRIRIGVDERRRSTAIEIDRVARAESEHRLGRLAQGHARVLVFAAVDGDEDEPFSVPRDTSCSAWIALAEGGLPFRVDLADDDAVPYEARPPADGV